MANYSKFVKYAGGASEHGIYNVLNQNKYSGPLPLEYKSKLEKQKFFECDTNPHIKKWSYETVVIKYISPIDGKEHRYFMDIAFWFNNGTKDQLVLLEIKPFNQVKVPVKRPKEHKETFKQRAQTYIINISKWKAAWEYAQKIGALFCIYTEAGLIRWNPQMVGK
jgi:hypothetical protein